MQRTFGGGAQLAMPCLLEDAQHTPLLAKLQDPSCFKKASNVARLMQSWLTVFKQVNRVAGWVLFSTELFSELGTSFDYCTDVSFICKAVCMVSVEIPPSKHAMIRKKKASEFIGANRTEALGSRSRSAGCLSRRSFAAPRRRREPRAEMMGLCRRRAESSRIECPCSCN